MTEAQRRTFIFMAQRNYREHPSIATRRTFPGGIVVGSCVPWQARCVYRYYDGDEQLLYVGCTMNLVERTSQHRRESSFFEFVEITIALWHPDAEAAFAAELAAIKAEAPIFNEVGRPPAVSEWLQQGYLERRQTYRRAI